ncbi:MAG: aspartyl/asparaginyl beta-hydroxylase domain-containing protein [Lysobacterales bacterium]
MHTPATPQQLESLAMQQYERGDLPGAAQSFRALLEQVPTHATALQFLGFEASQRQDYATAIGLYQRAVAAQPEDAESWYTLAMAHYAAGQLPEALEALQATLARDGSVLQAMLYQGLVLEQMGRAEDAAAAYLLASRHAEGNLDPRQLPPELRQFLNHAMDQVRAHLKRSFDAALAPVAAVHGEDAIARIRKGAYMFAGVIPQEYAHPKWRPGLFNIPDLPVQVFFDRSMFDWAERVEAATDMVRAELIKVMEEDGASFVPYVNHEEGTHGAQVFRGINKSMDWTSLHFYRHGERVEETFRRCPGTGALLESLDLQRVPGYGPEVMFSVLRPHSRIPAHYGAVNGRLVVHLPLIVPPNCGALRACGEEHVWQEGRLMMFDDTFEHEAWNDSDHTRVVLLMDTWNPYITPAEREAFCAVMQTAQRFESGALGG